jgi:hypothetical protein
VGDNLSPDGVPFPLKVDHKPGEIAIVIFQGSLERVTRFAEELDVLADAFGDSLFLFPMGQ